MKVYLAKRSGFCPGVKKAVDTAREICGEGVYILGELIHNESVIEDIKKTGSRIIDDLSEAESGTLIIRSHGVGKNVLEEAERKGLKVVNCTCPFVMKTQKIVYEHYKNGYKIVIAGKKDHPEVIGINGWCGGEAIVVNGGDYDKTDLSEDDKVCLVAQTTFSVEEFKKILAFFTNKPLKTLEVFETICYTTIERQKEAEILSSKCDAMIVVGGKNSSNTKELTDICKANCKDVYFISDPKELDRNKFIGYKKVGIVAGASTPDEQSMEVFLNMEQNAEKSVSVMEEAMAAEPKFRVGQKISATISSATDSGLMLYIPNTKKEILLDKSEIDCENYEKDAYAAKVGDEIEVMITGLDPVVLSEKRIKELKEEEEVIAKIEAGEVFTVTCTGTNKGGLVAKFGSYDVFVPSSQIRMGYVKDLTKYVGKTLRLKAEKVEKGYRRKQIVGSQRVILEAEKEARDAARKEREDKFFASISEGDVVTGKVVRFTDFGAFVEVNGFDCLAHISDLAWVSPKAASDVLEMGKEYEFKVLKCDQETKKVSLGYKQLQPKPWELAADKYAAGDVIKGKVVRIVPFGAFVEVEKGIDGLVHVSQISHEWLENPTSVLKVGDEVEAKILEVNVERERMTLSIKALTPAPEKVKKEDEETGKKRGKETVAEDEEPREWTEGGVDGISLGDLINQ